ncbi:hypothetical protein [Paenalcaligenes faecalis]|uniref:hypothetical protein n=1 Tax=Paenalcaligenes faecalis TaxID=2980099 RepID=UPI0022B9AE8F|nr:hypothetical protein [Paenalcaligenes faecalis]
MHVVTAIALFDYTRIYSYLVNSYLFAYFTFGAVAFAFIYIHTVMVFCVNGIQYDSIDWQ